MKSKIIIISLILLGILISGCEPTQNQNTTQEPTPIVNQETSQEEEEIVESPIVEEVEQPIIEETTEEPEITPEIEVEQTPEVVEEEPEPVVEVLSPNIDSLVELCDSECNKKKGSYCNQVKELVISEEEVTYGTCRSFAKYRRDFNKCSGYCKSFGQEKETTNGCELESGKDDSNCDGK